MGFQNFVVVSNISSIGLVIHHDAVNWYKLVHEYKLTLLCCNLFQYQNSSMQTSEKNKYTYFIFKYTLLPDAFHKQQFILEDRILTINNQVGLFLPWSDKSNLF